MSRRKIVAGNWKLNGSKDFLQHIVETLVSVNDVDVVIAPPFPYLEKASALVADLNGLSVSAQNVSSYSDGAFTGEVSVAMLKDIGADSVIVGHSERRELFGETDAIVAEKISQVLKFGLTPILCVGETLEQREQGSTIEVCSTQIKSVLDVVGAENFDNVVIAYEPVWAIGTGKSASSAEAQEVHASIRKLLSESLEGLGKKVSILYGGSVKAANAKELFEQEDIDGALVGGASLKVEEFNEIIKAAGI
ncbi:triose-phosphate isomerase [Marinomonas mediterranea]|uniref:triose-phosphate isomerase n=1 Tax=Marinomonas mediterranea TaxID=119864 RepID=UPI0023499164|nr:triose-phosphate isomerase [Marinomonas mediterranea]WCN08311.1 triose-phosphate isomerase [Marinomonas mediterranea]